MQSQLLAGLCDRSDRPALLTAHCDPLVDQLAVAPRHPPLVEIEVVFKADADVAPEADRRRNQRPLVQPDPDHLPVRAGRQRSDLMHKIPSGSGDSSEHAHDQAELVWRPGHPHVDQWTCVADVTAVEGLYLEPNGYLTLR